MITGTPGSGKTTLAEYAKAQKDNLFFDADEIERLCEWREFKTGKVLGLVTEYKETGQDAWYETYGWYWRIDRLKDFLNHNPNAIICGSSENVTNCYEFFDKLAIIRVTEGQLLSNIVSPQRNNPFGKTENQRKNFMKWQDFLISEAEGYNPTFVDGNSTETAYLQIKSLTS